MCICITICSIKVECIRVFRKWSSTISKLHNFSFVIGSYPSKANSTPKSNSRVSLQVKADWGRHLLCLTTPSPQYLDKIQEPYNEEDAAGDEGHSFYMDMACKPTRCDPVQQESPASPEVGSSAGDTPQGTIPAASSTLQPPSTSSGLRPSTPASLEPSTDAKKGYVVLASLGRLLGQREARSPFEEEGPVYKNIEGARDRQELGQDECVNVEDLFHSD